MPAFGRQDLENWVERWLEANRVCEQKGDWKPLADFYTEDATYGWNIGPKEDVMCVGRDEIRDVALGLEMEGLENWVYEYQKVLVDEKLGEIVGFWKQIVNKTDGSQDEIYGIGGSWFRLDGDVKIEWQRDFFDFGHVAKMFGNLIESGDLSDGMQNRIARSVAGEKLPGYYPLGQAPVPRLSVVPTRQSRPLQPAVLFQSHLFSITPPVLVLRPKTASRIPARARVDVHVGLQSELSAAS